MDLANSLPNILLYYFSRLLFALVIILASYSSSFWLDIELVELISRTIPFSSMHTNFNCPPDPLSGKLLSFDY